MSVLLRLTICAIFVYSFVGEFVAPPWLAGLRSCFLAFHHFFSLSGVYYIICTTFVYFLTVFDVFLHCFVCFASTFEISVVGGRPMYYMIFFLFRTDNKQLYERNRKVKPFLLWRSRPALSVAVQHNRQLWFYFIQCPRVALTRSDMTFNGSVNVSLFFLYSSIHLICC